MTKPYGVILIEDIVNEISRKYIEAKKRAGWKPGYAYRTRTEDRFEAHGDKCAICGQFHLNPYEGGPRYIRPDKPVKIAKAWATSHKIKAIVERRPAMILRQLGKKYVPQGTYVKTVELIPETEWGVYREY